MEQKKSKISCSLGIRPTFVGGRSLAWACKPKPTTTIPTKIDLTPWLNFLLLVLKFICCLLFLTVLNVTQALECVVCNSKTDVGCNDPSKSSKYLSECDEGVTSCTTTMIQGQSSNKPGESKKVEFKNVYVS